MKPDTTRARLARYLGGEWAYEQAVVTSWHGRVDGVPVTIAHHHRDGGDWRATVLDPGSDVPRDLGHGGCGCIEEAIMDVIEWRLWR